jgi:thiamine biosynthesis lipoprotein
MNCNVELACYPEDADLRLWRAERWLRDFEARFSRFRDSSELSALNASGGRPFQASSDLFRLVQTALKFARRTGGVFDPTILPQLQAAGYDASFELLGASDGPSQTLARKYTWQDVQIDAETTTIVLRPSLRLDLGGIGKGWAVDRVAGILGSPCMVNIGGDLYVAGKPHDADQWLVGVEDPFCPDRDLAVLPVVNQGIATSSTMQRRWGAGAGTSHHLIDPATGRPSQSDAIQVTVIAPTAVEADVHAKVALLLGTRAGAAYLRDQGISGLIVGSNREIHAENLE